MHFFIDKFNWFKNLWTIASAYILDITMTEIRKDPKFQNAFKATWQILDIGEEHLEFLLDLISQTPYRIFKWSTPNPKINMDTLDILGEFDTSRLEMLSDLMNYSRKDLRQIIAIWINSFNFLPNNKQMIEVFSMIWLVFFLKSLWAILEIIY